MDTDLLAVVAGGDHCAVSVLFPVKAVVLGGGCSVRHIMNRIQSGEELSIY